MAFGITASMVFQAAAPMVLGSLFGGGSDAPQKGADQQIQANNSAIAEQRAAAAQQRADLAPWTSSGGAANNELMRRLGIGGNGRTNSFTPKTIEQLRGEMRGQFTTQRSAPQQGTQSLQEAFSRSLQPGYSGPTSSGIAGGEFLTKEQDPENRYGGIRLAQTQPQASTPQFDEAGFNTAVQNAFDAQGQAREGEKDPLYGSLLDAPPAATQYVSAPAPVYKKFGQDDLDSDLVFQNTFKTALDTGTDQINARAASGGNYGSGAALKALTRFGATTANSYTGEAYNRNLGQQNDVYNRYQTADNTGYNRHQTQQNDLYNRNVAGKNQIFNFLSGPSSQGQSAAAGVGAAGLNSSNQIGGYLAGNGNAQSAGTIGSANATNQMIGGATDAFQWNQLLNKNNRSSSYNTGPSMWKNGNAFSDTGDY